MLQVCGWLGALAMIYLFNSAPNGFSFLHSLLHVLYLQTVSRCSNHNQSIPIRHILKDKKVNKLTFSIKLKIILYYFFLRFGRVGWMKRSKEDKMRRKTFLWGIHYKAVGTQSTRCVQVSKETLSKVKGKKKRTLQYFFSHLYCRNGGCAL